MSIFTSRFILETDPYSNNFVFNLPNTWETRPYEYEWAKNFAETEDIVLDAACGLSHPLKFYLADKCKEVYACDIDGRILSKSSILKDIEDTYGTVIDDSFLKHSFNPIHFSQSSLTNLPYQNKSFDKIFCISVLEHLSKEDMEKTFKEFRRTLKDQGLLIVTFDYPAINLGELKILLDKVKLKFHGDYSFAKPSNVLVSTIWGELNCFRAVLIKD
ncbi:class I SAM-dependent methyltransferase [Priestia filamentosa]|uniref:class I SAM-dependent methyltransferase n=1 Tax=Priestia filamentosa TaxID=1402861 RepID=UPI001FB23A6D|nr:class I SAM-dependent methyltransferase [Priestia filamentosa]UOE58475.1 class I SAM-dependent methyltransferase [Priestia filamentosa]